MSYPLSQRILTAEEGKQLDIDTIKQFNFSDETLMELAGCKIADEIIQDFEFNSVCILLGPGNNAGDGWVVLRHLSLLLPQLTFNIIECYPRTSNRLYSINKERFLNSIDESKISFNRTNFECDLLIDALFGIGLNRKMDEEVIQIINLANSSSSYKVSVDIPSGLHASNGKSLPISFNADITYSVGYQKQGFFFHDGPNASGKIKIIDIGFIKLDTEVNRYLLSDNDVTESNFIAKHKYDNGFIHIIAGSRNLSGAAYLATLSAIKSGATAVKLYYPAGLYPVFDFLLPEALKIPIGSQDDEFFTDQHVRNILKDIRDKGSILIGPGLGREETTLSFVENIISNTTLPLVVDADALYAIQKPFSKDRKVILTPHLGELRNLSNSEKLSDFDRIEASLKLAENFNCSIFSKGIHGFLAENNYMYVLPYTNEKFIKPGFGDVFAGLLASELSIHPEKQAFINTAFNLYKKAAGIKNLHPDLLIQ